MSVSICFVCLGNICRSPTAAGVMRHVLEREGLASAVLIDSAGTDAYHAGELPDQRAREAAQRRGIQLVHRARRILPSDFARFDYLLAMDAENLSILQVRAPADARAKIFLLRSFDPSAPPDAEVPDPYYGGDDGFEQVLDMVERAAHGLLEHLRRAHPP
jgi:protein-tyrosine phosphatase